MPSPIWRGPTDQLLEMPDSPSYDLGMGDVACTRTYMGTHTLAIASILPRGTIGTGAMAGWMVKHCKVDRQRGAIGKLTILYGASGAASGQQLPPDELGLTPFEVNPALEKHPRYASLTDAQIRKIFLAVSNYQKDGSYPVPITGLENELGAKLNRGFKNYYLSGFKYSWTRTFYTLTGVANVGGFIQVPLGPLAGFIPGTFSCLRQADDIKWTGAVYKYTMSWLCGPAGHFDTDIY